LIVPVRNSRGELAGLQFIRPDGTKKFLTGTALSGSFFPIGGKDKESALVICEGVATGLSLHECLGLPVLAAFTAGNLSPVAKMARTRYPEREIILAADNDAETDGNPGVTKATAAAVAVGGSLAVPRHEGRKCDWNDLHQKMGVGEVSVQFMTHKKPEASAATGGDSKENLPSGFSIRSGGKPPGLWHTELKAEGEPVETWIGPPLHVLGATRDENNLSWGLLLQWHDQDGVAHTWAMPKALLVGKDNSAWLGRLADEGWSGAPGTHARKLLALYLTTYRTERRARCVDRTGWHR
jgi:putative DNA primase/helicase